MLPDFGDGGGHRLGGGPAYDRAPGYSAAEELDFLPPVPVRFALAGVAAVVVAAVASLGTVPPLHLGIQYNGFTKAADTAVVYGPGRYFLGPFNKFMLFPSAVQTIEFTDEPRLRVGGVRYEPLHTRTKDGLGLHMQVSLQYRLPKETVGRLYGEFNMNYEPVITSSVRDTLIRAASEYEAQQLWQEREIFGDRMQELVTKELAKAYAECWGLQLMLIDLPDVFEHRIVVTQLQKQNMLIKEQEQRSTQIRAETKVIEAEFERQVKILKAGGQANYTIITKQAQAEATRNKIATESEVFTKLKEELQLSPEMLVQYQRYSSMDDLEASSLYFGFGSSMMLGGR